MFVKTIREQLSKYTACPIKNVTETVEINCSSNFLWDILYHIIKHFEPFSFKT